MSPARGTGAYALCRKIRGSWSGKNFISKPPISLLLLLYWKLPAESHHFNILHLISGSPHLATSSLSLKPRPAPIFPTLLSLTAQASGYTWLAATLVKFYSLWGYGLILLSLVFLSHSTRYPNICFNVVKFQQLCGWLLLRCWGMHFLFEAS